MALNTLLQNRAEKVKLLKEMLEFSSKEKAQLEAGEVDDLIVTTKMWEVTSQKIDALDKEAKELYGKTPQNGDGDYKEKLKSLEDQAIDLLNKIQAVQLLCNQLASDKMAKYRDDLQSMKKSNKQISSYTKPQGEAGDGIYFDQKK